MILLFLKSNINLKKMITICLQNNKEIHMFKLEERGRAVIKNLIFYFPNIIHKAACLVFDY